MFEILEADIVIMQETKIQRKDLQDDMVLVPGWDAFFSLPKHKKGNISCVPTIFHLLTVPGYSGVVIYTRNETCAPIRAEEGITGILCPPRSSTSYRDLPPDQQIGGYPRPGQLSDVIDETTLDSEGRCVLLEFPAFVLLGVYSPANRDESRDDFRHGFFEALDIRIRNLIAEGKEVVLTGDLNVVGSEFDSSVLAETLRKDGMSMDEWLATPVRRLFNQLIFEGTVRGERDEGREHPALWDLCRCFHPGRPGMNTCWNTKLNTRPANYGARIDYVLCSNGLKAWFTHANIQEGLMGSDHCPVFVTIADTVTVSGEKRVHLMQLMNPPDMFSDGQRQRDWSASRDLLPLSAKLIPEFDRRQSIRDMFKKQKGTGGINRTQSSLSHPSAPGTVPATPPVGGRHDDTRALKSLDRTIDRPNLSSPVKSHRTVSRIRAEQPPQAPPKRSAERADPTVRSQKKSRANVDDSTTNKPRVAPGQLTLQGFFRSANTTSARSADAEQTVCAGSSPASSALANASLPPTDSAESTARVVTSRTPPPPDATPIPQSPGQVFDPIQAKESWSKLLGKRVAPRCEHNEPCISLVTKKPGVNCGKSLPMTRSNTRSSPAFTPDRASADARLLNCRLICRCLPIGRSFYICPRPLGPSGEKEKGSEWRCSTFIWSSDWGGPASKA